VSHLSFSLQISTPIYTPHAEEIDLLLSPFSISQFASKFKLNSRIEIKQAVMGNCLERSLGGGGGGAHCDAGKKKRAVLVEEELAAAAVEEEEEVRKQGGEKVTEVKIRITRKQLEELLRRLEEGSDGGGGGGAVVSELLCMTSSCNFRHRPEQWRPSLHVIPE
jgi:hypothetical protein